MGERDVLVAAIRTGTVGRERRDRSGTAENSIGVPTISIEDAPEMKRDEDNRCYFTGVCHGSWYDDH